MDLKQTGGNERKLRENTVKLFLTFFFLWILEKEVKFSNYNLLNHATYYVDSILMAVL